jgi:acyl-CoA dehydrogenase
MEFCAREAMQILGGASYIRGNKVERIYRDVRVNAIGGGSEEILHDLAARQYAL